MNERDELSSALYLAEQTRTFDQRAIHEFDIPGTVLMERAGASCLRDALDFWPGARSIAVVTGLGNNAGDGFVIGRLAKQRGLAVKLFCLGNTGQLRGDAQTMYLQLLEQGVKSESLTATALGEVDLVFDGIFGTGLNRAVEGAFAEAIGLVNAAARPVIAIDIPSGLHADTGSALGTSVKADLTTTFVAMKRGLFTGKARDRVGVVRFDTLGVPSAAYDCAADAALVRWADVAGWLPVRARDAHKGSFGHMLVVGGNQGYSGAARMAAEAGARVGAGLVSVATHPAHAATLNIGRPELMCRGVVEPTDFDDMARRASVIALGPGLGLDAWARDLWQRATALDQPMVIDADALNILSEEQTHRSNWILTPHPGEAARLLSCTVAEVETDRFRSAALIAERYGGICLLKGAGTVLSDGRRFWVCKEGNPGMASGGMGDVLTGVIAGLLAQRLSLPEAAVLGGCLHARAGDLAARAGERGLLASDLIAWFRALLNSGALGGEQ